MRFMDILGTVSNRFQLGLKGLWLKNTGGKIRARNPADTADAPLVGSSLEASGDNIVINEDASGADGDFKITISRPGVGMAEDLVLILPAGKGAAGYVLSTDGNGNLDWVSSAAASNLEATDTTSLAFDSIGTVSMFQLPADAVVLGVRVAIDEAFDGAPSLSIGASGALSRYLGSGQVDLTAAGGTVFEVSPGLPADDDAQDLVATFSAGGASQGAARMLVSYVIPS